MIHGIAIFGLNGSGKSTLAHALAQKTGYYEMDAEDYYFPRQRLSRRRALEHAAPMDAADGGGRLPFSQPSSKAEAQTALLKDADAHPDFILSGVTVDWSDALLSRIDIAFWLQAPLAERLRRIQAREEARFGARVLPGGDLYNRQARFRSCVQKRDPSLIEACAGKLRCPVVALDGTLPVSALLQRITDLLAAAKKR